MYSTSTVLHPDGASTVPVVIDTLEMREESEKEVHFEKNIDCIKHYNIYYSVLYFITKICIFYSIRQWNEEARFSSFTTRICMSAPIVLRPSFQFSVHECLVPVFFCDCFFRDKWS